MRVAVIGAGRVGLASALVLAYVGHRVRVAERDPGRRRALQGGRVPYAEPGLDALLAAVGGRLTVAADAAAAARDAEAVLVAVGTGRSEPRERVAAVVRAALPALAGARPGRAPVVVIRSTLPPGGTRAAARELRAALGRAVPLAYHPEFLRPGRALADVLYPDRVVVGSDDPEALHAVERLYAPLLRQRFRAPSFIPRPPDYAPPPLVALDPLAAELVKLGTNALLAVKVSFVNELAALCEALGTDVTAVARGIGLDPRLGPDHLHAGLGWGGPCLPADLATLRTAARRAGVALPVAAAAARVNRHGLRRAAARLEAALGGLAGCTVAVLGLAFKPGTADARGSPALALVRLLRRRGARVRAHDPAWPPEHLPVPPGTEAAPDPYAAAAGADAVVLATAWPEYAGLDLRRLARAMRGRVVLDGRNLWDPQAVARAGLAYLGVGR